MCPCSDLQGHTAGCALRTGSSYLSSPLLLAGAGVSGENLPCAAGGWSVPVNPGLFLWISHAEPLLVAACFLNSWRSWLACRSLISLASGAWPGCEVVEGMKEVADMAGLLHLWCCSNNHPVSGVVPGGGGCPFCCVIMAAGVRFRA